MWRLKGKGVFLLVLMLSIFIMGYKANAVDTIDRGSLEITHSHKNEPLANVRFSIYKFANFNENGGLEVTETFKKYPINFENIKNESDWYLLYDTLATYVKVDKIPALKEEKTNTSGRVKFNNLDLGIYLVIGESLTKGGFKYEVKPFLVSIPTRSEGKDVYNVKAYTKVEKTPIGDPGLFVQKKWVNDKKENRPKWIKVSLYRNNVYYDSAILNEEGNWQHRWEGLEEGPEWNIVEEVPNGYKVTYEKYGEAIIVSNTGSGSSTIVDRIPQTGAALWKLTLINIMGIVFIVSGYFIRKSKKT